MGDVNKLREEFIRELAEYFASNQAEMSIRLERGSGDAVQWARLRGKTPLHGYPTVPEAIEVLTRFLVPQPTTHGELPDRATIKALSARLRIEADLAHRLMSKTTPRGGRTYQWMEEAKCAVDRAIAHLSKAVKLIKR